MLKKLLIAAALLVVLCGAGLYFRAHAIFSSDLVRNGVAAQMTSALGQPVQIGTIGASIFPRVTMTLGDVRIGDPVRITIARLNVGTALRALLSRRIEHAAVHLSGARVELPLPAFAIGAAPPSGAGTAPSAVTVESIDEIVLDDVEIVSGGRSLRGDVEVVPHGAGMTIRTMTLGLDGAEVKIVGEITDFAGPTGNLTVTAGQLNMLDLLEFASAFASGAVPATGTTPAIEQADASDNARPPLDLAVTVDADRAMFGTLSLERLKGRARLTGDALTLDPIAFGLFGGTYDGSLALALDAASALRMRAALAGVDMAALTAFAGKPDSITGRLDGTIDVTSRGTTPDGIIDAATGTARLDITQGTIAGLGLVRAIVIATSMRADATPQTVSGAGAPEPFSRLGATLAIAGGTAQTDDLMFESDDVSMRAKGRMGLDGTRIAFESQLQLSDALSKQSGRDLVRYTQADGRVTLPATISGSAGNLAIRIDMVNVLQRAVINKATEEAGKAIRRGIGDLLNRPRGE